MNYERKLLTAGRYKAQAISAVEEFSSKGDPQIKITWNVYDGETKINLKSYLTPKMGWMIDGLKKSLGIEVENSRTGSILASDITGRWVFMDVDLVESQRDHTPMNQVTKYLPFEGEIPEEEEEVPFS